MYPYISVNPELLSHTESESFENWKKKKRKINEMGNSHEIRTPSSFCLLLNFQKSLYFSFYQNQV